MLQMNTVHQETFSLLKSFASQDKLRGFYLAGGTALALRLGHRISVDLDFFTLSIFDSNELLEFLKESYEIRGATCSVNSLSFFVTVDDEPVKVDMIRHNYPFVQPVEHVKNIRLCSLQDIAAMKLNAVANRGAKKDFFDIYALLTRFTLKELLTFFQQKYEQLNSLTVLKSLVYFADADLEPNPVSLLDTSWLDVQKEIVSKVQAFSP